MTAARGPSKAARIRQLISEGRQVRSVAAEVGCSTSYVNTVLHRAGMTAPKRQARGQIPKDSDALDEATAKAMGIW